MTARGPSPGPIDRRFAADAEAHRQDVPRFCPRCGTGLARAGLAVEYWSSADRVYYCWCAECRWTGEIVSSGDGVVGHEPEH